MNYKYDIISESIKTKIQTGIYAPNTHLPPENTLAEEYNVSRITIRNALATLIEEGYVYPIPGKGNYVLSKKNDNYIFSLKPENILREPYSTVRLLGSIIIKPTIDLVYHLRVAPDSRIIQINWLLYHDQTPIAYDSQFIPYFSGITLWENDFVYTNFSEVVSFKNSLLSYSENVTIKAVNSVEPVAEKLNLKRNTPVMLITEKIFDDDQPLGMRRLYIRQEWCRLIGESYLT